MPLESSSQTLCPLSRPRNARLVQRSLDEVSSESDKVVLLKSLNGAIWCNTEFECLCARSILVSRGSQHVTTLYHDMLRRTCHRQLPKHRSRGRMLDLQLTLPVYNSKTSSYGYSECCSTANRLVVWPACLSLVVTRSH